MLKVDGMTIAGGEHAQDYSHLISMMRDGLLAVVQPDLAIDRWSDADCQHRHRRGRAGRHG